MAILFAGRSFLATFGLVFLAIAVLFAADTFLAKTDRVESAVEAARLFEQGRALMARGNNDEAIGRIKDAIVIERGNRGYRQALAQAQFDAGKTADAESTLAELLQRDPGDGLASLVMARVLVKESRFAEAIWYFHRAIYGKWDQDSAESRLRVRFELIDLLERHNLKEDLLAELLPVQDQAPRDLRTRIRMGRLFLLAGSPTRAADVFRGIIRDSPANSGAFAGLGEAEFVRSNYRAALRDFQVALRWAPDDQPSRERLALCNEVIMLDPTTRGLGLAERFRRSRKLVELTLSETSQCAGQNPPPALQGLLDTAGKALKAHVSATRQSEAAESNLDVAEQLWQARKKECKSPPSADSPLALVLARLSQ
jgi:tetratricopeptide (TPR) repeat protein